MVDWTERIRQKLASRTRLEIPVGLENPPLVRAAVLVPLYTIDDQVYMLLTRRTDKVDHHKGQVSFPGGRYDETDKDYLDTALREAYEEVGLRRQDVEILGALDDMLTTTGFVVTPYVGVIPYPYPFQLNEHEVAAALHVPLSVFVDPTHFREEIWERNGKRMPIQFYLHNEDVIWGATARIIKSFLEGVMEEPLRPLGGSAPYGRHRYVQTPGCRLHYLEWGGAGSPPMVLLHGSLQTAHSWDELARVLHERYHVFVPDQRGHGDSEWAKRYTLDDYVQDLEIGLDAWSKDPVILLGMSMGGMNALVYTVRHPERVRALVLIDVGPELQGEGVRRVRQFMVSVPDEFRSLEEAVAVASVYNPRRSKENLRGRLFHNLKHQPNGRWVWKYDPQFKAQGGTYSEPLPDLWTYWEQITAPTLIVRGQESNILSEDVVRRMVERRPGTTRAEVAGAGHSVVGDNLAGFLAALEPFLSAL